MRLFSLPLILASLAATVFGVIHYPLNHSWLAAALLGYGCILWLKPESWLFALPAILPVADLAAWSGWLFFEELDLFVLVTVAIGYWKLIDGKATARMPGLASLLLAMLALSYAISAWRGLTPLQPFDFNAFSNYLSHYNSLRLLKPFVWALLLLPLMRRSLGKTELEKLFVPGILTGLALVSIVSVWERAAFPGLMNFSSDYRITASFPEMHTGGAALDAYLSLTLPFVIYWIFKNGGKIGTAAGILLLVAASYAALVTFSRGLYLGYAASAIIMGFFSMPGKKGLPMLALLAVCALLMAKTFGSGGYRGLFAGSFLLWASIFLGGLGKPDIPLKRTLSLAAVLAVSSILLIMLSGKGAYLAYGLSLAVFLAGFVFLASGRNGLAPAFSGFLAMMLGDVAVNWHWGGGHAAFDGILVSLFAAIFAFGHRRTKRPLWIWNRESALAATTGFLILALAVPVLGNYYMKDRFLGAEGDMQVRTDHWSGALQMMGAGWEPLFFGNGLGRFPEAYFWKNREGEIPGTYLFETGRDRAFLRLEGARHRIGYGEVLRYGQRIEIDPYGKYRLQFDARTAVQGTVMLYGICEKYLLYAGNCSQGELSLKPDGAWHHYEIELNSNAMGSEPWYRRPTLQFSLADGREGGFLDVSGVKLEDWPGHNLIHNGDFSHGGDRWYFSSDHYHMPWHEKNLFLHVYFDQGFFGLAAFSLLFAYALARLLKRSMGGDFLSSAQLASFAGFIMVGLFDSVMDFPRIALLFYLLLFCSLSGTHLPIFSSLLRRPGRGNPRE